MNKKIEELAEEAGWKFAYPVTGKKSGYDITIGKFAELIVTEAFRAGILYSAKKYSEVSQERFTGNDVSMFLEMEAVELTDDEVKQHFGIE